MTRMTEQQLNAYAEANGMTPVQAALHIMQQPKPLANHPEFPQYKLATNVIIAQLRGRVHELEAKLRKEYEKDRSLKQRTDALVRIVEQIVENRDLKESQLNEHRAIKQTWQTFVEEREKLGELQSYQLDMLDRINRYPGGAKGYFTTMLTCNFDQNQCINMRKPARYSLFSQGRREDKSAFRILPWTVIGIDLVDAMADESDEKNRETC